MRTAARRGAPKHSSPGSLISVPLDRFAVLNLQISIFCQPRRNEFKLAERAGARRGRGEVIAPR